MPRASVGIPLPHSRKSPSPDIPTESPVEMGGEGGGAVLAVNCIVYVQ